MDYKRHIIQSMGNNEVRTILSRMMSLLQGKGVPENTLKEKLSALAIAMDALDFIDEQTGVEDSLDYFDRYIAGDRR